MKPKASIQAVLLMWKETGKGENRLTDKQLKQINKFYNKYPAAQSIYKV